jgi:hypothetical protein
MENIQRIFDQSLRSVVFYRTLEGRDGFLERPGDGLMRFPKHHAFRPNRLNSDVDLIVMQRLRSTIVRRRQDDVC